MPCSTVQCWLDKHNIYHVLNHPAMFARTVLTCDHSVNNDVRFLISMGNTNRASFM